MYNTPLLPVGTNSSTNIVILLPKEGEIKVPNDHCFFSHTSKSTWNCSFLREDSGDSKECNQFIQMSKLFEFIIP